MTSRAKTKTEISIEENLTSLDPDSTRYKVLNHAKKFKSNWLDLAEMLSGLCSKNEFTRWGYASFEDYCKKELKIKPDTAMKLVSSFGYIKKYKPELTTADPVKTNVPDFKAIDHLHKAEEDLEDEEVDELRKNVFEENYTPARVKKKIHDLTVNEEEEKKNHEEALLEKMRSALNVLSKIIPIFEPSEQEVKSLADLGSFIDSIEVQE